MRCGVIVLRLSMLSNKTCPRLSSPSVSSISVNLEKRQHYCCRLWPKSYLLPADKNVVGLNGNERKRGCCKNLPGDGRSRYDIMCAFTPEPHALYCHVVRYCVCKLLCNAANRPSVCLSHAPIAQNSAFPVRLL